ncbi:uncharacterized protein N7482_003895 [Penicillium canariense]|uniref:HMG box domain-containing protein n=1 Tax=Penicillium canariense TaxID=189055 RepID=A0A9W9I7D2_9EURO|nr:uncharacterized protein N7482_003895 [Penicillium canariense]KAJ5168301.1 hypothetical protein N7482_003895 [Penicillium canariense]
MEIPVKDIDAYVNRSVEKRQEEAKEKNDIPRPMNSFMLYRSAYIARIKSLLGGNCNQNVSKVAGTSWKMETKQVRDQFEDWANTERRNHATSHPHYKFKPHKGPATTTRRSTELTPPRSSATPGSVDPGSSTDWGDCDYPLKSMTPGMMHGYSQSFDTEYMSTSRGSSPFGSPEPMLAANGYMPPNWNTSYPASGLPTIQPSALHGIGSHVEEIHFPRASPLPQEAPYSSSNGLAGLPGGSHHELLQPQFTQSLSGHMDPQLLSYSGDASTLPTTTGSAPVLSANGYTIWNEDLGGGCYLPAAHSRAPSPVPFPHTACYGPTMQRNSSWDAKYSDPTLMDGSAAGEVDLWFDHPHPY